MCMRVSMKNILLFAAFLCQAVAVCGQPVCTVTRYDEDTGMAQWHVTQIVQDKNGMIWFSTWNGLDRFDGYDFTHFKSYAGDGSEISSNRIRDIRLTEDDNLYCRVDDSWYLFDQSKGSFSILPDNQQAALNESKKGRGGTGIIDKELDFRDKNGVTWHIDRSGVLSYKENGMLVPYPLSTPFSDLTFYMPDRQGNLWLLSRRGVYKLSFTMRPNQVFPQEKPAQTGCFFADSQNRYWVTTKGDATVRVYDGSSNSLLGYLSPAGSLSKGYVSFGAPIYCMAQTRDGRIWMGSKPKGLFALTPAGSDGFHVRNIKIDACNDVYDIKEDRWGHLWLATMGGGVCCVVDAKSNSPSKIVDFIGKKGYPETKENKVRFIHITEDNHLLAATTEGLLIGRVPANGNVIETVFKLHQREASRSNSLSCNATMDILEMPSRRLFISTESGGVSEILSSDIDASQLDFHNYNMRNGLNSDVVIAMNRLDDDNILLVGSNQLMTLNIKGKGCGYFDAHFFHDSYQFAESRPMRLPDGRWLFGLRNGAFTIDNGMIRKSLFVPPIVLTGVSFSGKQPQYAVNHLDEVVLQPDERTITLYFSALDYSDPKKVNYAFKMDESTEWNYIGHNHSVSFVDLDPGTYHITLRSTNADGVWVDNNRTLTIIVTPTFWESWYGELLIILLILAVVGGIIYTYLYIKKIKQQRHEALEAYLELISRSGENSSEESDSLENSDSANEVATVTSSLSSDEESFMRRIMEYVEQHIDDAEANIGDMADAAATSRSGLNRKMKSIVGLTPADFLREARIKRACTLLTTTGESISDVAWHCGFSDPKYFSRCFKASLGVSPSEYRDNPSS